MLYVNTVTVPKEIAKNLFKNIPYERSKFLGETLQYNEPPKIRWEPKALGKVKSREETIDGFRCDIKLYSTANSEKWLKDLQDYLWKEAERRRRLGKPDDSVDALRYYCISNGFDPDDIDKSVDSKAFEKLNDILRNAFRTVQEREIAKYSVKSREELNTPYDIWEKNKIEKGEFSMNDSIIKYNEMKANARKAYDEAMAIAEQEKKAAETEEAANEAANVLKTMYDAYLNAGFSAEQAEKFVTIQLEKLTK